MIGSYPQISKGLKAKFNLNYLITGGSKVFDVFVSSSDRLSDDDTLQSLDVKLELDRFYNVATTSFYVFECGDGVTAFSGQEILATSEGVICNEIMIEYLKTQKSISGTPPRRLIRDVD